ncbi:MAG: trimethylamine methyltransferase family protein [Deltaproteobacteria bacterium]|nr:trimethylamine methyltransferase family protein [Deltaproteobacteria bacterium]
MARFYGLPSRGGGAGTDALHNSIQSGYESMMSLLISKMNGINLVLHAAGILGGYAAMSFEKFLVDVEMIRMVEHFGTELVIDENTLALDTIHQVGPGGHFLTQNHTLVNCRKGTWLPHLAVSGGSPEIFDDRYLAGLDKRQESLLKSYRVPDLPPEVLTELNAFMADLE